MQDFAMHALALVSLLKGEVQPSATCQLFALIFPSAGSGAWLSFPLGRRVTGRARDEEAAQSSGIAQLFHHGCNHAGLRWQLEKPASTASKAGVGGRSAVTAESQALAWQAIHPFRCTFPI